MCSDGYWCIAQQVSARVGQWEVARAVLCPASAVLCPADEAVHLS
jgi:hypothetical protein